jgi:hypothetical protein
LPCLKAYQKTKRHYPSNLLEVSARNGMNKLSVGRKYYKENIGAEIQIEKQRIIESFLNAT